MSSSTLADIITKNTPGADRAVKIAQALGTTVEYLMTGEDAPPAPTPGLAEPATEFRQPSDAAIRSVADRYKEALVELEAATQAAGVLPDDGLKQILISLIFRYGVPFEDVVAILTAKAASGAK